MTLNIHSPIAAGPDLRIPSAPAVHSQVPKPPIRICSRCGAVLSPHLPTSCGHCRLELGQRRGISDEGGLTIPTIQRTFGVGQFRQVSPTCVSCPFAIDVSKIGLTIYCNVCRMRLAGTKPKPTRRINPIPTTITQPRLLPPSLPPNVFPDTQPVRAPAYPSFFNSRGELIAPPPSLPTPQPVITIPKVPRAMRDAAPVRVCTCFGCGLRLGPNPLYDFCDACLRLGRGRGAPTPLPPPKRRPKRIKKDEPPVAASLSKAQRDLDTARATEIPPQVPCEEPPEPGNDDLDLELKYPEVVVQSCPSLENKASDATVPLEPALGPGRSLPLPLVLPTRPLSYRSLRRTCETPECGGTVSPSATWPRCHKCSLQRWKERQQAAIAPGAAVDPALPAVVERESEPGNADGHVPASSEANEVDRMSMSGEPAAVTSHSPGAPSDVIDKRPSPTHPNRQDVTDSGPSVGTSGTFDHECSRNAGVQPGHSHDLISEWASDLTDLSSEDKGGIENNSNSKSGAEDSSMIKIRIPVLVSRLPNARVCAIKRCNIALPPDHRWKICDSCRRYQRRYQIMRLEKRRRMEGLLQKQHESAGFCKPEISPLDAQNRHLSAVPRCRENSGQSSIGNFVGLENHVEQSPSLGASPYPIFQNRTVLLSEFSAMLEQFVEAQILYLRAQLETVVKKALSKVDPVMFTFNGGYSTVTGQRGHYGIDGSAKSGPERSQEAVMHDEIASVVEELNNVLLTEFKPLESSAIQPNGVTARYKCSLELLVPLRPLPKAQSTNISLPLESNASSSHVPHVKPMSGELQVTIISDDSHYLLLGQQTSIRLRVLG